MQGSINLAADVKALDAPVKKADKQKAVKEVVVGSTENGKDIVIRRALAGRGFTIHYAHGGQVPQVLDGVWLRFDDAMAALRGYAASPQAPAITTQGPTSTANTRAFS